MKKILVLLTMVSVLGACTSTTSTAERMSTGSVESEAWWETAGEIDSENWWMPSYEEDSE